MFDLKDGRPMAVVVSSIRPVDSAGSYIADMTIDGAPRTFRFDARGPVSLSTERGFDEIFVPTIGVAKIIRLIGKYIDDEPIVFPVDIGEVLDFAHLRAAGGPEAAHRTAQEHGSEPDEDDSAPREE